MAGKTRSPNYPALSLPKAVEMTQRLWDSEKRAPMSHETAVTAMGFKSLSGPARVAIGALRQYGLIDKVDKGHIRLSDLAVTAILSDDQGERRGALSKAFWNSELFTELASTHADASENNIRSYLLVKKGFADDGARKAAKAFRDSYAFAVAGESGYTDTDTTDQAEVMPDIQQDQIGRTAPQAAAKDGVFALNVPFAKGSIAVQVRVTGDAISPAHLARVRRYLELAEQEWDGDAE